MAAVAAVAVAAVAVAAVADPPPHRERPRHRAAAEVAEVAAGVCKIGSTRQRR